MTTNRPATRALRVRIPRVVVRAGAVYDTPPSNGAWCCQHVWGFRYADDMRRLVASEHARVARRGRALHGGRDPRRPTPGGDRRRHRRGRRQRAGAAERQRLRHRRPRPRHPRALRRRDRQTHRRLRQRHADPHAHRRRPARRQGLRVRARRRRLPHQALRAPRARAPSQSARPQACTQQAACARDRRSATGSVSPRGPPQRPLRRADQEAVRSARSPLRCRRRCRQRRRATGTGVGSERGPVHQRRAHHGLGTAQTARRTRDHRHRGRRRVPHRHGTRIPDVTEGTVDRAPGLSVRLKLTLSYAGFIMLAGAVLLAAVWVFMLRDLPEVSVGAGGVDTGRYVLVRNFAPAAGAALAFLLVFGLVGGWILAGSMLAPLTRITNATRMAANASLSHRIQLGGREDEFRELADSFDAMLARLEAQVAEQQRFAANASHELRTPLAVTQTLLDVARNDLNRDTSELVDRLHVVNTRAIDLTEALLLLSRADQRSFTREHVDLSLIAEEAIETLLPLAERRGLTIETSGDVAPAIGSHALLLQLSTNLVHNAIVHNLPEQGTVWVTTSVHPERAVLTVENTGAKLTPQSVATLAEPFLRGTKRIRTDHAGVGLGLAIVKGITQEHDGTLTRRAAGAARHGR